MFGTSISVGKVKSPNRQAWKTPRELFERLHDLFAFTVDACASDDNALLPRYWTQEDDCRQQRWEDERVFCNPPFGEVGSILPLAERADVVCFLLPLTCLTTRYFGATPPTLIAIPPYRIKFLPPDGLPAIPQPTLGTVILLYGDIDERQVDGLRVMGLNVYKQER